MDLDDEITGLIKNKLLQEYYGVEVVCCEYYNI